MPGAAAGARLAHHGAPWPSRPSPATPTGRRAVLLTTERHVVGQVFSRSMSRSNMSEYRLVHFNTERIAENKFCSNKIITHM